MDRLIQENVCVPEEIEYFTSLQLDKDNKCKTHGSQFRINADVVVAVEKREYFDPFEHKAIVEVDICLGRFYGKNINDNKSMIRLMDINNNNPWILKMTTYDDIEDDEIRFSVSEENLKNKVNRSVTSQEHVKLHLKMSSSQFNPPFNNRLLKIDSKIINKNKGEFLSSCLSEKDDLKFELIHYVEDQFPYDKDDMDISSVCIDFHNDDNDHISGSNETFLIREDNEYIKEIISKEELITIQFYNSFVVPVSNDSVDYCDGLYNDVSTLHCQNQTSFNDDPQNNGNKTEEKSFDKISDIINFENDSDSINEYLSEAIMLEKQYKGITGNTFNKLSDNVNIENSDSNSDSINEYLSEAIMLEKQYKGVTDTEENHNVGNENERVFLKEKSQFKKCTNNVELYSHPIDRSNENEDIVCQENAAIEVITSSCYNTCKLEFTFYRKSLVCSMNSKNEVPIYKYMSLKERNENEEKFIPVSTKNLNYENLPLFSPSPIINSDWKNNLTLITSENYTDFIDVVNSSQENKNPCHPIATEQTKTNSSDHETCRKSCEYNSLKFDDVIFKDLYKTPIAKHSESFEMFLKQRERKLSEICDTSLLSTEERLESEKIRQKNLSVDRRETFCHYPNKINKIKYPILRKGK